MKRFRTALILSTLAFAGAAQAAVPPVRQALINDIEDTQAFVPAQAVDGDTVRYRATLSGQHAQAVRPQNLAAINALRAQFENSRNDYFNALFARNHAEPQFHDDPVAFQQYVQLRLNVAANLRKIKEDKSVSLTDAQLGQIRNWNAQLAGYGVSAADLTSISAAVASSYHYRQRAEEIHFRSEFVPRQRLVVATNIPAAQNVSYTAPGPLGSLAGLTHLISSVVRAPLTYAQQVASAIVDFSNKYHIDARLAAGLVQAESTFVARIGSWAGCYGLGQLSEAVAARFGVTNRGDIRQNMNGTAGYLSGLLNRYSTQNERTYVQGLFAQNAVRVQRGADLNATFAAMWPSIPVGVEDAVASYNAGSVPGHWYNLPLPRAPQNKRRAPDPLTVLALSGRVDSRGAPLVDHCYDRPDRDNSYCQTINYVPKVLRNYFAVFVRTTPGAGSQPVLTAGLAPAGTNG